MRSVLVLNQYAVPRSEDGGTRHIDLFGRLQNWQPTILATSRHHTSQRVFASDDQRFRLVSTPSYRSNGIRRIVGWLVYAAKAFAIGMRLTEVKMVYASSPQLLAVAAGFVIAHLRRLPFIMEVRDLWPESIVAVGAMRRGSLIHTLLVQLESFLYQHADRIVVVTEGWQDHFAGFGIPSDKLVVIPNGTEPGEFHLGKSVEELRQLHSISGFTAVFAGSHGSKDGIDLVLDAAAQLPYINFLLVGSGPAKSAGVKRAWDERLSNVEFRDPIPKQDLAGLLRGCDVGVHSVSPLSVFDQGMSPNKLFDYMAAQLPVVSNAEKALRRIMHDGECGRVGSSNDLVSCLESVYHSSAAQRVSWGERSVEILQDRYSRSAAAQLLERTLDSVCPLTSLKDQTAHD